MTNKWVYLLSKDDLKQPHWRTNSLHQITKSPMRITETNTASKRFYKLISRDN